MNSGGLTVFLRLRCSGAGEEGFSGTCSAFWRYSSDSAVLVPEKGASPALVQHSGGLLQQAFI